jgi:hypothetical protein
VLLKHRQTAPGRQEFFLNPAGLNLRDALPIRLKTKHIDAARRVVHHVSLGGVRRRRSDRWVPLSQEEGTILSGSRRSWDVVRPALRDGKILECDGRYTPGIKSLNYRLEQRWGKEPLWPVKTKDPLEEGRIAAAARGIRRRASGRWLPVHDHLEGWLLRFTLDEAAVERALTSISDPEKQRHAERVAEALRYGSVHDRAGSVCEYGRFHSVLTRTPRVLRSALRIDGEPLYEIDIANCQPLLLAMMAVIDWMRRTRAGEEKADEKERTKEEEGGGDKRQNHPTGGASSICGTLLDECVYTSDLFDYLSLCQSGAFYKELSTTLSMPFSSPSEQRQLKLVAMRLIFGRHRPSRRGWPEFTDRWPTMASFLADLKRGDHRRVAHTLQRAESELMIVGVCGELMERHPELPVLTIHDGLLVPQYAVEPVVELIRQVWGQAGASPKLKITPPA